MSVFHVKSGSDHEPIPAGAYPAELKQFSGPEESDYGQRYRFVFSDEKRTYIGFCDVPPGGPTTKNKLGRWLCALEGKPPQEGDVDPSKYVGKRYMVVYGANSKGNIALLTFSPLA